MATEHNQLFRKTALERLASPDLLDVRFRLVSYRIWVRYALPLLLALAAACAFVWAMGPS